MSVIIYLPAHAHEITKYDYWFSVDDAKADRTTAGDPLLLARVFYEPDEDDMILTVTRRFCMTETLILCVYKLLQVYHCEYFVFVLANVESPLYEFGTHVNSALAIEKDPKGLRLPTSFLLGAQLPQPYDPDHSDDHGA